MSPYDISKWQKKAQEATYQKKLKKSEKTIGNKDGPIIGKVDSIAK